MQLACGSECNHTKQSDFDFGNSSSDHGECIRLLCLACDAGNAVMSIKLRIASVIPQYPHRIATRIETDVNCARSQVPAGTTSGRKPNWQAPAYVSF